MFREDKFIDFHTHASVNNDSDNSVCIVSIDLGQNSPKSIHTIGRHPWFVKEILTENEIESLRSRLTDPLCLGMGEVGLDKVRSESFELQKVVFEQQLQIANEMRYPVIIHCVKAFEELLLIRKKFDRIPNWAIHGYSKKAELAAKLINAGFYISLDSITVRNAESVLKIIPYDRLFLETDDSENSISDVYIRTAELMNKDLSELKRQFSKNAKEFFGK